MQIKLLDQLLSGIFNHVFKTLQMQITDEDAIVNAVVSNTDMTEDEARQATQNFVAGVDQTGYRS